MSCAIVSALVFSAASAASLRYLTLLGRAVLASRPRRHGKEPVPRQTKSWKPRRPAFPVPQNRLQQVSRSSARVGSAREIPFRYPLHCLSRDELVCTGAVPGAKPCEPRDLPRLDLITQAAGACDCPSHLMKGSSPLPSSAGAYRNSSFLFPIPDSNCILPGPTRSSHNNDRLSLTCRFCSSYLYRRLSPQPGALPQPQLKKTKLLVAHQPASPHTRTRRDEPKQDCTRSAANNTIVIPRPVFSLFIS